MLRYSLITVLLISGFFYGQQTAVGEEVTATAPSHGSDTVRSIVIRMTRESQAGTNTIATTPFIDEFFSDWSQDDSDDWLVDVHGAEFTTTISFSPVVNQ